MDRVPDVEVVGEVVVFGDVEGVGDVVDAGDQGLKYCKRVEKIRGRYPFETFRKHAHPDFCWNSDPVGLVPTGKRNWASFKNCDPVELSFKETRLEIIDIPN